MNMKSMNSLKKTNAETSKRGEKICVNLRNLRIVKKVCFYHAIVVVMVMVFLAGCGGVETAVSTPAPDSIGIVEAGTAVTPPSTNGSISALATIKPIQQLNLSFGAGAVIDDVSVRVGESVTKGQLLATLDTTELELALQTAQE